MSSDTSSIYHLIETDGPLFRSHRFIVRDFTYDEEAIQKGKRELDDLVAEEKQLWVSIDCPSHASLLLIVNVA